MKAVRRPAVSAFKVGARAQPDLQLTLDPSRSEICVGVMVGASMLLALKVVQLGANRCSWLVYMLYCRLPYMV